MKLHMEMVHPNEGGNQTPEMAYAGGVMKDTEELRQLVQARGKHAEGFGFGEDVNDKKEEMRRKFEAFLASIAPEEGTEDEAQSRLH